GCLRVVALGWRCQRVLTPRKSHSQGNPPATACLLIPCSAAASTRTIHAYRGRVPGDRETRSRPEIKTPLAPGSAERLGERAGDERDGASCSVEESAHRHEPVDHPAITDRVHAHARVP